MTTVDPDTLERDPEVLKDIVRRFDGRPTCGKARAVATIVAAAPCFVRPSKGKGYRPVLIAVLISLALMPVL
jgi:hypothetical protein